MSPLDTLARILVLEGAGNVEPFTWSRRITSETLGQVQSCLGGTPRPVWFQEGTTGMYDLLLARASRTFQGSALHHIDHEDILQQALSGLTVGGDVGRHRFHAMGVLARENILSGSATPTQLAGGTLGSWLRRMCLSAIKKKDATQSLGETPATVPVVQTTSTAQILAQCMCGPSAVAIKLREIMQAATDERFHTPARKAGKIIMHAWFEALAEGRLMVPGLDWADAAGILDRSSPRTRNNASAQISKVWGKAHPVLKEAVEADSSIMSMVDIRLAYEDDLYRSNVQYTAAL